MGLEVLAYNANNQEHKCFADDLGLLQGGVVKGTFTSKTMHAYYAGHELKAKGEEWSQGDYHLKKDCPGKGQTKGGRSQNRVIVRVSDDALVEDWAAIWLHDERIFRMGAGFFERAKGMRSI